MLRNLIAHKSIRRREQREAEARTIAEKHSLSQVAARALAARGFCVGPELESFLNPTLKSGLPSPSQLKNLTTAAKLIAGVIKERGAIAICCDFDVDGLTGGSQVHHFLNTLGVTNEVFVPDRFRDGYGLNIETVETIAARGFQLILTIDFGTTNEKELLRAKELGLQSVVIDHHHVGDRLPPADVFINPQQAGCGFADGILCASGLAWYLVAALRSELPEAAGIDPKLYLDLACLGTICDMVPLRGANRVIARRGLELLSVTERPGLRALKESARIFGSVSCHHVSFGIGPRINAAGRMVHGKLVIELLSTHDAKRAAELARQLDELNQLRQDTEAQIKDRALEEFEQLGEVPPGIVVWNKDYHTGVIGIVAQRLVELFYRPAVVLGSDSDGLFKGSVRGIRGFSVVDALSQVSHTLEKFGGHEGAGGLSVKAERLEEFSEAFKMVCAKSLREIETEPFIEADTDAELEDLSFALIQELRGFAPFGIGNSSPTLLLSNLRVVDLKILKDAHLKATLSDGVKNISGMMWRTPSHPALIPGAMVNLVCKPDLNEYRGVREVYANIQAVEPAA